MNRIKSLLSHTYQQWSKHEAPALGAALAYYTVLSLAPLLAIAVAIAGLVFRKETVHGRIIEQVTGLMGSAGADAFQSMLAHAESPKAGVAVTIIGLIVLLFGASGVFSQLRKALNQIWDVKPKENTGWRDIIKEQFSSFAMVVGIGFLLLVSLVVTTILAGLSRLAGSHVPAALLQTVNTIVSIVGITVLFALIYRYVPEQTLPWSRLWLGSFATAVLFVVGKYALGLYLGKASVGSAYGAAGSLVVLLVWVYYSAQLFLFGAEFTRIYACEREGVCLNIQRESSAEAEHRQEKLPLAS
jgi:membrane protein